MNRKINSKRLLLHNKLIDMNQIRLVEIWKTLNIGSLNKKKCYHLFYQINRIDRYFFKTKEFEFQSGEW